MDVRQNTSGSGSDMLLYEFFSVPRDSSAVWRQAYHLGERLNVSKGAVVVAGGSISDALYVVEQVALYTRFSQFDKAVEAARKGITLAPDNADLYRMLGFGQIQLKQKEEGKKNLLKAKELGDPNAQTLLDKYAK